MESRVQSTSPKRIFTFTAFTQYYSLFVGVLRIDEIAYICSACIQIFTRLVFPLSWCQLEFESIQIFLSSKLQIATL